MNGKRQLRDGVAYGNECIDASNAARGVFMKGRVLRVPSDTIPGAGAADPETATQPDDTRPSSRALSPTVGTLERFPRSRNFKFLHRISYGNVSHPESIVRVHNATCVIPASCVRIIELSPIEATNS